MLERNEQPDQNDVRKKMERYSKIGQKSKTDEKVNNQMVKSPKSCDTIHSFTTLTNVFRSIRRFFRVNKLFNMLFTRTWSPKAEKLSEELTEPI